MSARYDIYESPSAKDDKEKKNVHARLITDGTIETSELAKIIEFSSSVTIGDIQSVLSSLAHLVGEKLAQGERVHIDGLGYFQMTLQCPKVKTADEVRGDNVKFKSVSFRPEKDLKEKLKKTRFIRSEKRNIQSVKYSDKKTEAMLTEYFREKKYITRREFQRLFIVTPSTARNRIKNLVEQGKLVKEGSNNFPFYEPAPGYYGK